MKRAIAILMLSTLACFGQLTIADPGFLSSLAPAAAGGTPSEVTDISGLYAWYKPETLMTNLIGTDVIGNGTNIIAWGDSSGNNHVITTNNPTAATPVFNSAGITGLDVGGLVFGSGKYMRVGLASPPADTTIFMTWRINSGGTFVIPIDSTNSSARQVVDKTNVDTFGIYAGSAGTGGTPVSGNHYIQCGVFNSGGNDSLYTNGVAISTSLTAGSQSLDGITVGSAFDGSNYPGSGEFITEIVIYNRNLNATEIGQVFTIMNNRAGVY